MSNLKEVALTPIHDSHYKTAYEMFKDKTIFGGLRCLDLNVLTQSIQLENVCNSHPHNFYLQLLAETGLIGFSFLFIAFSYVCYAFLMQVSSILFKKKRHLTDYQVCLLAGILISVWPISPNGNFFNNWLSIVYSLPIGFYLQSIYSKN